jgi:radical SAM superfamily enzyme YgiQ (UPF0313 family)
MMRSSYKRILLVNPGRNKMLLGWHEPLNLALLASFIRSKGFSVLIADRQAGEDVIQKYNDFKPDIVGVTSTIFFIQEAYNIAEYFRERKVPTVLGGAHAAICAEEALNKFDMVVKGEGEFPLLKILSEGHERGIFFSDKVVDINQMPLPARDLLCMRLYLAKRQRFPHHSGFICFPWNARVPCVMISRGCSGACAFCHNTLEGLPFRIYSPDKVVEELSVLKDIYKTKYFVFSDENIFSNRKKIKEILSAIASSGLNMNWGAMARVDSVDEEILEMARRAGCIKLIFGFESGSQRMLDDMNKRTKVDTAYRVVSLCRKHRIKVGGFFIVGHPNEEMADVRLTRNMIKRLRLDSIAVDIAMTYPATPWWKIAEERKLIPKRIEWDKFDAERMPIKLNQVFSVKEMKKIQLSYYGDAFWANPGYLWRIILAITFNFETFKKGLQRLLHK